MGTTAHRTFSVLSYNIHKGFSSAGRAFVLSKIRHALHEQKPDVVFLQEVIGAHKRHSERISEWPALPQLEFIAQNEWPHTVYGQNCSFRHGHHGNGLLSKFTVREWQNVDVSTNRLESRGILHASLDIPGTRRDLQVFCVHLGLTGRGREKQIARLVKFIDERADKDAPVMVAGDFNDWTERASAYLRRESGLEEVFLSTNGRHARTFPSRYPLLRLDRIYFRGLRLKDARVLKGKPWSTLSDHTPVSAEFEY